MEQIHTTMPLVAQQPVDLLDGVLAAQATRLASECPMIDTASDAPVITPSTPLASDTTRLA